MFRNITARRRATASAVVAAGVLLASAVVIARGEDGPGSSPAPSAPIALAAMVPVLSQTGGIKYQDIEVPGDIDDAVVSIGPALGGLAISYGSDEADNSVRIADTSGAILATFTGVQGIALTNPSSSIVAFVRRTSTPIPDEDDTLEDDSVDTVQTFEAVAVDAATGQEIGRSSVSALTRVMAVGSDAVAMSDDDVSHLWTPGQIPELLSFVPDEFYVVGVTDDRVVATNLDGVTMIYDLVGNVIAQVGDLISWSVSHTAEQLAGATEGGLVTLVSLVNGAQNALEPTVEAASATYSEDGGSLVVNSETSLEDPAAAQSVCPTDPDALCETVEADAVAYLPNEAKSQLIAQSY